MTFFSSFGKDPDFAYPRKVLASADSLLKTSGAMPGAEGAAQRLYAIELICKASTDINPDERFALPAKIGKIAEEEEYSPARAMMELYEASMVNSIYSQQQWMYDKVEIPDEPVPADMSAWSGRQFKQRISTLVAKAVESARELPTASIAPFKKALSGNELSDELTPTVVLFVMSEGADLLRGIDEDEAARSLTEEALKYATVPSTAYFALKCNLISVSGATYASEEAPIVEEEYDEGSEDDDEGTMGAKPFLKLYEEFSDAESARYVLLEAAKMTHKPSEPNEKAKRKFLDEMTTIENSLRDYPKWYNNEGLREQLARLTTPSMRISTSSMCPVGGKIRIYVEQDFTEKAEIIVKKLPVNSTDASDKTIANAPVFDRIALKESGRLDFDAKDTIEMNVGSAGCYVLIPSIKPSGKSTYRNTGCQFRALPWLPVALNDGNVPMLAVVNAADGTPEQGVAVNCYNNRRASYPKAGLTRGDGFAELKLPSETYINRISLYRNGTTIEYPRIHISGAETARRDNTPRFNIFTSRSVYHPGDTLEWAAIAYETVDAETGKTRLLSNMNVKAVLFDANDKEVETGTYTTDDFGRIHGQFATRVEGLTGSYRLTMYDPDKRQALGSLYVPVSDFKLPTFKVEITNIERDMPEKGAVRIGGRAMSYAGMAIGNAKVSVTLTGETSPWWFGSSKRMLGTVEGLTDGAGLFTVEVPASMLENAGMKFFRIKAEANVTASGGESERSTRYFTTGKPYSIMAELPG
ncbi:MAG: hypothetical protein K2M06_02920, partial [Muribaculaceae bacterium]|nr:hypothetical protein [Muribaculaceae bacterium]